MRASHSKLRCFLEQVSKVSANPNLEFSSEGPGKSRSMGVRAHAHKHGSSVETSVTGFTASRQGRASSWKSRWLQRTAGLEEVSAEALKGK